MPVSASLQEIKEALSTKIIQYLDRPTTGQPYANDGTTGPRITIISPSGDYITYFDTFGSDGYAGMELEVKVQTPHATKSHALIALDDYLSVGQGNSSSIVDAINQDPRTLGGLVDECVCLRASGPGDVENVDDISATLYVSIVFKKVGANA